MEGNIIALTVQQLDEPKATQKGTPQRGVKTEEGWIQVRGENVASLAVGNRIVISEPSEFKNKKYSELKSIVRLAEAPKAPAAGAPAAPPAQAPTAPAPTKHQTTGPFYSGAIKLDDYIRAVKNFHGLTLALAPDVMVPTDKEVDGLPGAKIQAIAADRAQARAAMLNTFSIALTSGKIDMSEPAREPGSDQDSPPWERK